jgi:Protein of unknown function (DUF3035)
MRSRSLLIVVLLSSVALGGCEQVRDAAGGGKESPDEFAVVTKAPLVIPPDFNLKPPKPGAAPTNQSEPTQAAASALFTQDPAQVAATLPATMSAGERYFLAAAGVQNSDPAIRQQLASDTANMRGADDSFTSNVLFWQGPGPAPGSTPVDANAEARRIDAGRGGNTTAAPPPPARTGAPPAAPDDDSGKGDDSGWLSGLWPF